MKKISFFLVLILTLSFVGSNNIIAIGDGASKDVIEGVTYLNLDEFELKGNMSKSQLIIDNLVINNALLSLKGSVKYDNNNSVKINIKGDMKKSKLMQSSVTGFFEEKMNNFEVIHLSISEIADKNESATLLNNIAKDDTSQGKYLKLYLFNRETREFNVFEGNINNLKGNKNTIEQILNNYNQYDETEAFGTDYWQHLIFKPIDGGGYIEEVDQIEESNSQISILSGDTDYISRSTRRFTYSETYSIGVDGELTYWIKGYAKCIADDGHGGGVVWIDDKYTTSNYPFYESNDSPFGVGHYDEPIEIVVISNGYDRFTMQQLSAVNATKKSFASANVSFGIGVSFLGMGPSLSFSYDDTKVQNLGTKLSLVSYENPEEDIWPTKTGGEFINHLIGVEGAQVNIESNVRTETPDGISKTIDARFKFPISAKYDGSLSWGLASMPNERNFDFTTWDYRP